MCKHTITAFALVLALFPSIAFASGLEGFYEAMLIQALFLWGILFLVVALAIWNIYKNKDYTLLLLAIVLALAMYLF